MAQSDTTADLLTRLRNGALARHRFVDIRTTKFKLSILRVLEAKGYLQNLLVDEANHKARVFLKYSPTREPLIQGIKRISSPGCRQYVCSREIPRVYGNMGVAILSTSQGVLDGETARQKNIGGELLCCVW